jgi:hypothetical protein
MFMLVVGGGCCEARTTNIIATHLLRQDNIGHVFFHHTHNKKKQHKFFRHTQMCDEMEKNNNSSPNTHELTLIYTLYIVKSNIGECTVVLSWMK